MKVLNESQRFTQWWLQLVNIILFGFLVYVAYKWFVLNEFFGNVSPKDQSSQVVVITATLLSIALIYIFRLKTTIDEIGIHYQFIPINLTKKNNSMD
jgi:TRAP-type C4-dicarboxylate transport system permease small subunit